MLELCEHPEVENPRLDDREARRELHTHGLGGDRCNSEAALAEAGQAGVLVVTGEVDERREDGEGIRTLAVRVEGLGRAPARIEIVRICLQLH